MKTTIKKMGINGEGIGFQEKTPVFLQGAMIDEIVEYSIVEKHKRYLIGKLERVIEKSPHRVDPISKHEYRCGSAPLMIMDYETQLSTKYDILRQSLIKYAQVNPRLLKKVVKSPNTLYYRNQCKLPVKKEEGKLVSGLYVSGTNYFAEIEHSVIHEKGVERMRLAVTDVLNRHGFAAYDFHQKRGIRTIVVRGFEDKYQVTIVSGMDKIEGDTLNELLSIGGLESLWQSIHTTKKTVDIFGNKMIHLGKQKQLAFTFDGLDLEVSPRSFFQLNTQQAVRLYQKVRDLVGDGNDLIVEAYSGVGAISLYLKDKAKRLIGIEEIKDAVVNAKKNAERNNVENVEFVCADAGDKLTYISKNEKIDVLVVDPPRSGLDDAMLTCILQSRIGKLVYVSCNPATLGKDIAVLQERYEVQEVTPFDMFPQTQHVESVVLLVRK